MAQEKLTFEEWNEVMNAIESSEEDWERKRANPYLKKRSANALMWLKSARAKLRNFMG